MESEAFALLPKGRYEITEALGRGAFGAVYRGRDTLTGKDVVLKLLHLPTREAFSRIDREITIVKKLGEAPHIVSFGDGYFSADARSAVLVSEWINGPSLQSLVDAIAAGLPNDITVAVTRQICKGLDYLHQNGIVHRDIKPSNVLITREGVVKLCDFGIAISTLDDPLDTLITTVGSFVGTLRYAAPEMVSGQSYGPTSDIYALGITVLFMLLGHNPLPDASVPFLMREILRGSVARELPETQKPGWGRLLRAMLDIEPERRPSADQLFDWLEKTFPPGTKGDNAIIADFIRTGGFFDAPPPPPPRMIESSPEPDEGDSLAHLVRSLTRQIAEVQSAVADITASFTRRELPPTPSEESEPGRIPVEPQVEATFTAIRQRLALTWRVSLGMTFVLFAMFISMVVLAVVFGLIYQKSLWGIIFGGSSVLSLLTVVLWRPMDKMLLATIATQQLELIQINYQKALSGSREERREAFRDVSTQLHSLLTKMTPKGRT